MAIIDDGYDGTSCPNCEDDDIEGDAIDIDDGFATQGMWCNNCEATWTDVYKLQGYRDLELGDNL